jgi:hypothetical protein
MILDCHSKPVSESISKDYQMGEPETSLGGQNKVIE